MNKKIKMIVFDQDGTLYPRENKLIIETRKKTKTIIRIILCKYKIKIFLFCLIKQ